MTFATNLEFKSAGQEDDPLAELKASFATHDAAVEKRINELETRLAEEKARADELDTYAGRSVLFGLPQQKKETGGNTVEKKAFGGFLRRGVDSLEGDERKAMMVSPDSAGGYLAPTDFVREVIAEIVEVSPIRQAARIGSTSAGSVVLPRRTANPTANWVGEVETRPETAPAYGTIEIPVHEAAAYVDISLRLLEDSAVDVQAEVASALADEFGRIEGEAFCLGNGVLKPTGILSDTGVKFVNSGSATALTADGLISLAYALPTSYRKNASWLMSGSTLAAVRTLKDTTGQYLWQPALAAGQPETLLGRPIIEAPDMPEVAANAYPIAFGDIRRAYRIFDKTVMTIIRDPFTQAARGMIRFHARRRVGGAVALPAAIRKLKIAA